MQNTKHKSTWTWNKFSLMVLMVPTVCPSPTEKLIRWWKIVLMQIFGAKKFYIKFNWKKQLGQSSRACHNLPARHSPIHPIMNKAKISIQLAQKKCSSTFMIHAENYFKSGALHMSCKVFRARQQDDSRLTKYSIKMIRVIKYLMRAGG